MTVTPITSPPTVWDRVVCGIDPTPASLEAARFAAELMPAAAPLTLCAVATPRTNEERAVHDWARHQAEDAVGHAQAEISPVHRADVRVREGAAIRLLLDELSTEHATLVAVGSHGHTRAAGMRQGSVATAMLHHAPCSVLIAHPPVPGSAKEGEEIIVAYDGSPAAQQALATARELGQRLSLRPRLIVATGGAMIAPHLPWLAEDVPADVAVTEDPRGVVEALVDASASARLLILGSRHLQGLPALWSVSERAGHAARCPVLVVR
jgi:nucleotide-binding universal stress UspA family protein